MKQIKIQGDESEKITTVQNNTWTPCWGEEFEFSVSSIPKDAKLTIEVNDDHGVLRKNEFVGETCLSVSELNQGIRVIAVSGKTGKPCRSARLLVRFMFI